jgi:hypothetical protein
VNRTRTTRGNRLAATLALLALAAGPAFAQVAAPADVYYQVHVDERYKYYAFAADEVTWASFDTAGTALSWSYMRDSTVLAGVVGTAVSFDADAGTLSADLSSYLDLTARTGAFHSTTNSLHVDVYIKGPSGTPYWITTHGTGQVEASRTGGLPGSLQSVNGNSLATFMDSTAYVDSTGSEVIPVDEASMRSGLTTTPIVVGADTYSYAGGYTFQTPARVLQAVCILGCMTQPALFHAASSGHVELDVFPYANPAGVPGPAPPRASLELSVSPNPLRSEATIAFRAPAGTRTRVLVFDAGGRTVSRIHDAAATGQVQRLRWDSAGMPRGLYFVRVVAGGRTSVAKVALVD